ncbi:MAG: hypothetical protein FJ107_02005 [Deltaproteobacteria bacterium]|nr:hypothetical protein [Deltaproteobacteria bacterium]
MEVKGKEEYKTWGRSRSNRLVNYDYSKDRPIHVTICTDNKKNIFESEVNAKIEIEELLKTSKDLEFRILCYCLMPDHLHIIISPGDSNLPLSKFLNVFKGKTTTILREREGLNKIWQRSAFDHIIRAEEGVKTVIEYIVNNPVRKGIVENANDYPHSKSFEAEVERYL